MLIFQGLPIPLTDLFISEQAACERWPQQKRYVGDGRDCVKWNGDKKKQKGWNARTEGISKSNVVNRRTEVHINNK
jgi:hypothetical protein